jgi:hypothetical protein
MAWTTVNDSAHTAHRLYTQEKTSSCGVACVMMMIQLMQNQELAEDVVRAWFGRAEGSANIDHYGVRDFENIGSTQSPIITVLSDKKKIAAHMHRTWANVSKHINEATAKKPCICHVAWDADHAHWVVLIGKIGHNYLFLDPAYGVVETALAASPHGGVYVTPGPHPATGHVNFMIQP